MASMLMICLHAAVWFLAAYAVSLQLLSSIWLIVPVKHDTSMLLYTMVWTVVDDFTPCVLQAPVLLRLAYHDAGTFSQTDGTGGLNASIQFELDRPENFGLKRGWRVIQEVR